MQLAHATRTWRKGDLERLDVAVLGGGVAGLTAAYLLRDQDLEVLDSADHIGGRTRSLQQSDGIWLNTGAQYVSTDRVKVVELADKVGARLLRDDNLEEYWRGLYPRDPDSRSEIESCIERITAEQMDRRPPTLPELDDVAFDQWLGEVSPDAHRFFDRWCQIMNSGSSVEISLYGALWPRTHRRLAPVPTGEPTGPTAAASSLSRGVNRPSCLMHGRSGWVRRGGFLNRGPAASTDVAGRGEGPRRTAEQFSRDQAV